MENDVSSSPNVGGLPAGPSSASVPPPIASRATPPPLVIPPPVQRRSGRGWRVAAMILAILLAFSLLFNLGGLFSGIHLTQNAPTGRDWLEEVLVEDNDSAHKIAIIDVRGMITSDNWDGSGSLVELIEDQLERAEASRSVKAVILKVDSPGGEVLASDDIAQAINDFQEHSRKPVVACMGSLAASGGYYVSAPCRWIVAHELTITGSIGVIMHGYNYRGLLTKVGIRPEVYKSGKFKDMLSGEKNEGEIDPEERRMMQALIDETYARFKGVVKDGRATAHKHNQANNFKGRPLIDNWSDQADGRILSGRQAFESGFVDELGNFDTAVERAQALAGIQDANLVRYQRPFEFSSLFRLLGRSENRSLKIQVGPELPRLQAGRLYFLTPTALP